MNDIEIIEPTEIKGNEIIAAGDTFNNLVQRFINYVDVQGKTLATYRQNIKPFMRYIMANGITEPTRDDIKAYKDELIAANLKPATVKSYIAIVKVFFSWLDSESLYKNIAKGVKIPKVSATHTGDYLNATQMASLLTSIRNTHTKAANRDFVMCNLMVSLGLRTVEIERANVEHLHEKNGETFLTIHGKGGKIVDKKLDKGVAELLHDYIASRGTVAADAPLFVSTSNNQGANGRIPAKSVGRIVKAHLNNAGIANDRITAHSLRHTAAMLKLKSCDGDLRATQDFMRHANPATTLIYLKELDAERDTSSADIMAQIRNAAAI